jgi:phage shock protein PspC (stress-responsive transcriptional regulator)
MAGPASRRQAGAMNATATDQEATNLTRPLPLSRPLEGRMLAGVAAGVARYLGVDVTVVRIVLAVLALVGGAGVPLYLAGWLLIPEEGREQSIAGDFIQSRQARSR